MYHTWLQRLPNCSDDLRLEPMSTSQLALTGSSWLQTTLFAQDGFNISLKQFASPDGFCTTIDQAYDNSCACTSNFYLVNIVDAHNNIYASAILFVGKPYGAGAIQRALLQSLESRALALFGTSSVGLQPHQLASTYRWVLSLLLDENTTVRFGVI